jgi:putative transport protein
MFTDLLHSSYFSLFLIVALGFMLGRIKIKGLSLDVSAVIFIALLFGHFGVIIPKELGNFGLVLFILPLVFRLVRDSSILSVVKERR